MAYDKSQTLEFFLSCKQIRLFAKIEKFWLNCIVRKLGALIRKNKNKIRSTRG